MPITASKRITFSIELLLVLLLSTFCSATWAAYRAPVWSREGMAATPHPEATNCAVEVLRLGGNAVDAAVAAAFALSVVEPYHSGLGGGEFALLYIVKTGEIAALDARECAPQNATPDLFLDSVAGKPIKDKSSRGGLAVGVPGSVRGRVELIRKYGHLSLSQVVAPSVRLAREGFIVDRYLSDRLASSRDGLAESKSVVDVFFKGNKPLIRGKRLTQPILAQTLEQIGSDGGQSFYHGEGAQAIVASDQAAGGVMTVGDLDQYRVFYREPVHFTYRGLDIYSMPPPSSGGACLSELLNILEGYPIDFLTPGSSETYHLLASAFEFGFADRAAWLGDPDFTPQPVRGMSSKEYATGIRAKLDRNWHKRVENAGNPWEFDSDANTSHISVMDRDGNMCAITTSINTAFGSLVFVPELGIFLNNTLDDFAMTPQDTNEWGLVGNIPNCLAPGKRPLSSMSPTLILKDRKPYITLGSVGGPRIITSVVQMIVNLVDFKMDIQAAMDAPRIHTQWRPAALYVEKEVPPEVVKELRSLGWQVEPGGNWSLSQTVMWDADSGCFYGASDARGVGTAGPIDAP